MYLNEMQESVYLDMVSDVHKPPMISVLWIARCTSFLIYAFKVLVEYKANVHRQTDQGLTAVVIAAQCKHNNLYQYFQCLSSSSSATAPSASAEQTLEYYSDASLLLDNEVRRFCTRTLSSEDCGTKGFLFYHKREK